MAIKHGWHVFTAAARYIRAEVLLRMNHFTEAQREVAEIDRVIAAGAVDNIAVSSMLLKAELAFALGDDLAGEGHLSEAFRLARRQRSRAASCEGRLTARLCAKALSLGIEPEYVRTFIRASGIPAPDPHDPTWPWSIAIRTLGGFEIEIGGRGLGFSRKTPKRLILLLKAIIAYGGRDVPEEKLIDAVWPNNDGDAATNALRIAVHRLRKLLDDPAAIVMKAGRVGLDPSRCWLDLWCFEYHLARRRAAETDASCDQRRLRAMALYRGDFLAGDQELWWAKPRREQCRRMLGSFAEAPP